MTLRWRRRPEGSTWGDFGPDDELGRLNLLTPEKVRQGAAEVREGLTFCLSLPLDVPGGNVLNPRRHPPQIRPTVRASGRPNMNFLVCEEVPDATDVISDDLAVLHLQYSTQWDSLAHVGSLFDVEGDGTPRPVYYNGFRAGSDITGPTTPEEAGAPSRAQALGIERLAERGMQGRGVMIDLHAHLGEARVAVGYDQLRRILDADGVVVEAGDMVCLHTGFAERLLGMNRNPDPAIVHDLCAGLDGRDRRLLNWITDSGLVALIADNYAVEVHPALAAEGCCATLPLHEHCLFRLGVNLGELWHLTPLATWLRANKRSRFLLTAPPLRLPGAVGSPTTPIATV
ncbi:cyclase [Methylobacterium tarhaniae]|uniref:Cyclase n=1 Tax=Methylobacterium tarhaniae TaxID=1187852 RepID=A0A0J6SSK9_9HYPH|nr:cyclase family protein [Methylobacterium tarhaniae]KMO38245.1 cyclase [Methylobacterium tarhaniae]